MPIIQVNMMVGRTVQQKRDMVAAVTEAVVSSLGAPRESVRILINELQSEHFAVAGVTAGSRDAAAASSGDVTAATNGASNGSEVHP